MMENGGKKGDTWAEISQQKSSSEGGSGEVVGGSAVSNKGVGGQVGGGGTNGNRGRAGSMIGRKGTGGVGLLNPFAAPETALAGTGNKEGANLRGNIFATLLNEGEPQSPILSANNKRGRVESPPITDGSSPPLRGKGSKLAKVIDDTQNSMVEGKYILGEKIDRMEKGLGELCGIKALAEKDKSIPDYLKRFMDVQLAWNREVMDGWKAMSNSVETWGNSLAQIDTNFKTLNQDMSNRDEQVNTVKEKLKSVDDKESQKKVIEEIMKADRSLKICQLKVDIQTDSKEDTLNEGAKAALKVCKDPQKVKNQLKKVVVLPAANKSYKLDSGHHVDLKVICKSREDRFSLDKELKSEGLKTGYHWPSAIFKQIKEIRQKYLNLGMIDINKENIDMGKIDLLIRPTRSCERLVVKMRPKGLGKFEFLETIGMPFTDDLSICKSNFW